MTESATLGVEAYGHAVRVLLAQHVLQGLREAIDSRDDLTLAVDQRFVDKSVICAIDQRIGIEQEETFHSLKARIISVG